MQTNMIECTGIDGNGIPRVWGRGTTPRKAMDECQEATRTYIVGRPDTGPLERWQFVYE